MTQCGVFLWQPWQFSTASGRLHQLSRFDKKKPLELGGFYCKFFQIFTDQLISILHKTFQKAEKMRIPYNAFYGSSITLILKPDQIILQKNFFQFNVFHEYKQKVLKVIFRKSNLQINKMIL